MKGGDVMVIAALKALHSKGLLNDASITFILQVMKKKQLKPKEISRGDFINRAKQHDIALAFETAMGPEYRCHGPQRQQ
jgi:glutamate carboxypeptidase